MLTVLCTDVCLGEEEEGWVRKKMTIIILCSNVFHST